MVGVDIIVMHIFAESLWYHWSWLSYSSSHWNPIYSHTSTSTLLQFCYNWKPRYLWRGWIDKV